MILVDLTFVRNGDFTFGAATVTKHLLEGLAEFGHVDNIILLVTKDTVNVINKTLPNYALYSIKHKHLLSLTFMPFANTEIERFIKEKHVKCVFSPFLNAKSYISSSVPTIGLLHDVQKFTINRVLPMKYYIYKKIMSHKILSCKTLITISESEKANILNLFPVLKNIHVIHNSINISDEEDVQDIKGMIYILNVNTLFKYKNILTLVKAFDLIKDEVPHKLVIKSMPTDYWHNEVMPYIKEKGLSNRIYLLNKKLTDGQMTFLYRNASLFVSPSTMEGFGLTPVEAAICGTPVIVSNIPALRESTMGLVSYMNDCYDYRGLAKLMINKLNEPPSLKETSKILKQEYSLDKQVKEYWNILSKYAL